MSVLMSVAPSPDGVRGTTWARLRYKAECVAAERNIRISDLLGTTRERKVVVARALLYRHAREMGLSYPRIGKIFGRDHTTVLHSVREHFPEDSMVIDIQKGA